MTDNQIQTNYYNQPAAVTRTDPAAAKTASASNFSSLLQNAVNAAGGQKPTDMDEIFQRAASQYGVPVNLLKAVAKTESGFDPDAVSRSGAQGVMQLMPSTAASLGVQNPLDAEQNIMGGAKYLSDMLNRYDGDTTLALAAYNAGSGNVAKYGGVPPFAETQAYISKVMDYAGLSLDAPMEPSSSMSPLNFLNSLGSSNSADPLNSFSLLSSILGSSSTANPLSSLSSLLAAAGNSSDTAGLNSTLGSGTASDYISLLQLLIAQMQTDSTQAMSSDLTDVLSSDSPDSSYGLL